MNRSRRKKFVTRTTLVAVLAAVAAVPLLGDMGVGGNPRQAAAHELDKSRQVTAISRATNAIDAFWVNGDKHIMTAGFTPAGGWTRPARIAGGLALNATSVHGVARAANRMDIFSVSNTRHVQTAFWNGSAWNGWHQLGSLRVAPGSNVHAIGGGDQMDLFAAGEDRVVYTNRWTAAAEWSGWVALPGITTAADTMAYGVYPNGVGGPVQVYAVQTLTVARVVGPPPGQLVQGSWNLVYRNEYQPDTGWAGWDSSAQMFLRPRTNVFPISHRNSSVLIFGTSLEGQTVTNGWGSRSGWGLPPEVLSNGATAGGTTVFAAVRQRQVSPEYAAVCIGTDGTTFAHHLGTTPGTSWEQIPGSLSGRDAFVMSAGADRYNVFIWGGTSLGVQSAGWTPAGGWTGWTRIDD